MTIHAKGSEEAQRLATLRSYRLLDTPFEPAYDDITAIAACICDTPIALISLIDETRQWFKSVVGLPVRETPVEQAFCAHAIRQDGIFLVPDTALDARFSGNPLVLGEPRIRFYAGVPLTAADGSKMGTVCVIDRRPRALSEAQKAALAALGRQAMVLMELRKTVDFAARLQHHQQRIMAIAGHDLRQPLQVAMMGTELALGRVSDPTIRRRLESVALAHERIGNELQALALSSGSLLHSFVPSNQDFSVQDLLATISDDWKSLAAHQGIQLRVRRCAAKIFTDPGSLRTILGNLVGNAIKYTAKGRVVVGCRRRREGLTIQVADNGIGIALERQKEVFRAFNQLDRTREGLGLGLSIVRDTADLLKLKVSLHSQPGRGTLVGIDVPYAQEHRRSGLGA